MPASRYPTDLSLNDDTAEAAALLVEPEPAWQSERCRVLMLILERAWDDLLMPEGPLPKGRCCCARPPPAWLAVNTKVRQRHGIVFLSGSTYVCRLCRPHDTIAAKALDWFAADCPVPFGDKGTTVSLWDVLDLPHRADVRARAAARYASVAGHWSCYRKVDTHV